MEKPRASGFFDPEERRREKQRSRDEDEARIAADPSQAEAVARENFMFSWVDPSQIVLLKRRRPFRGKVAE